MLSTARDIIFLWVARMVMFGIEFTGELPFTDVNIHSVIQAPDGRRMSKSLGTGIDPLDLIEGGARPPVSPAAASSPPTAPTPCASACSRCPPRRTCASTRSACRQGRDLANKLWNASRLILLRVSDVEPVPARPRRSRTAGSCRGSSAITQRVTELLDGFRFSHAALELYDGFWSELCDWYLELAKPRLYEEDNARGLGHAALRRSSGSLRLLHPVMPFVTEEIWSLMPGSAGLLAVARLARGATRRASTSRPRPSSSGRSRQ